MQVTHIPIDELARMPRDEALQRRFDGGNALWLRRFVGAAAGLAFLIGATSLPEWQQLPASLAILLGSGLFFNAFRRPIFKRRFRRILLATLLGLFCLFNLLDPSDLDGVSELAFLFGMLTLLFRLKVEQYLFLYGVYWGAVLLRHYLAPAFFGGEVVPDAVISVGVFLVFTLTIALVRTRFRRRAFHQEWAREKERQVEENRLRDELEAARKIQLQMLPAGPPEVPWLDCASLSLPATEVGGDYYDYFQLDEQRLAVVVGDVAGHGVTSGILLSGVRSCLHLLHGFRVPPVEMLGHLDEVVRQTTTRRMFMTLVYARFDHADGVVSVASAGHAPLLRYCAEQGVVEAIEVPALPLGTPLPADYKLVTVPCAQGDVFVFYTDGISELLNEDGEEYEPRRLTLALEAAAGDPQISAKEIRTQLLADLWTFKGNAEQRDDLTLVVAKVR